MWRIRLVVISRAERNRLARSLGPRFLRQLRPRTPYSGVDAFIQRLSEFYGGRQSRWLEWAR